jgi:hypothetical protein
MFPFSVSKTIPVSLADGVSVSDVSALIADKLRVFDANVYRDESGEIRLNPKSQFGTGFGRWNGLRRMGPGVISFHQDGALINIRYEFHFYKNVIFDLLSLVVLVGAFFFQKVEKWWVVLVFGIPVILAHRYLTNAWFGWFLRKTLKGEDPYTMCGIKYW